jgi:hypothetical protein
MDSIPTDLHETVRDPNGEERLPLDPPGWSWVWVGGHKRTGMLDPTPEGRGGRHVLVQDLQSSGGYLTIDFAETFVRIWAHAMGNPKAVTYTDFEPKGFQLPKGQQ